MNRNALHSPSHPCFGAGACTLLGRVHLPVATRDFARSRFAAHSPGSEAVTPQAALEQLNSLLDQGVEVKVVGITGPGDPLARPEPTLETLRLVRERHPDLLLCLTTLGLDHLTLLMDGVDPLVVEALYAWIRPSTKTLPLRQAAEMLVSDQARAIAALKAQGITVKVNTTVYPGINADHVEEIAARAASLGASVMRLAPCAAPVEPSGDRDRESEEAVGPCPPDEALMDELRALAGRHIALLPARDGCGGEVAGRAPLPVAAGPAAHPARPFVAVCSRSGFDVDLHLGQAGQFMIYGPKNGPIALLETRPAPEPGCGAARWEAVADLLKDCFALLASAVGETPRAVLAELGLQVLITEAAIEGAVDALFGGNRKCGKG